MTSRTSIAQLASVPTVSQPLTKADFRIPVLLIALSAIPVLGGVLRLQSLSGGALVPIEDARFVASPIPIGIHVVSATLFSLLGAFQFSAGIRRRWPSWHRRAGRLLALCGLLVGVTGIWMTLVYPIPRGLQGPVLYGVRVAVGAVTVVSIVLAWRRILQRDVAAHEAWMLRAYALAQGAGTQALILLPWMLLSGESLGPTRDLLMTVAWALNGAVAEWVIRRRAPARPGSFG